MPTNFDNIKVLCGTNALETVSQQKALPVFAPQVCNFLNALSASLLANKQAKAYPDIITFAFFCRNANIQKLKGEYAEKAQNRLGRGFVFHVAPSNVPINFAYTLVAGLLAGNVCVVKASSKNFVQTNLVANSMQELLQMEEFVSLQPYVNVVVYQRTQKNVTEYFSKLCNARVIWGGDATIADIRTCNLPPRGFDVTFADRYSFLAMQAKAVLQEKNLAKLAHDFYNDTYLYDQNACSSPRFVYWLGNAEEIAQAKNLFWDAVYQKLDQVNYPLAEVTAVDKEMTLCRVAVELENVWQAPMPDNRIQRIQIGAMHKKLPQFRCAGGSFFEYDAENLQALAPVITAQYQTMAYYGLQASELRDWVMQAGVMGIDRIVPLGKTADFSLVWDGYDLILTLSRIIDAV